MEIQNDKKPYFVVLVMQCLFSGMVLLQKAVYNSGMNNFIFVFYRQLAATLFFLPVAFYSDWKSLPRLTVSSFCKIFMVSLLGTTMSFDVYGIALIYTSASVASACTNCLPAITFFLAVLFRLETWKIKTVPGMAKLAGIVICIGGALVLALYKGFSIKHLNHHLHHPAAHPRGIVWIKGVFLMLTSNTLFSIWIVFQGPIIKGFPSKRLYLALSSFLSTVQSFVVAIAIERDPYEWKLGWNLRLLSVTYCGVVVTGVAYYLQSYVIQKRGPVFVTMWTPFGFVITTTFSSLLLGEDITSGSVVGGALLVCGLYSVLWAKTREAGRSILPEANVAKEGREIKGGAVQDDHNTALHP